MFRVAASLSAAPLASSGTAVMPPVPVLTAVPGLALRLNQTSRVNCAAFRPGAAPIFTQSLVPSRVSANALAFVRPPQTSVVQTLLSSQSAELVQLVMAVFRQLLPTHASTVVGLPSLQSADAVQQPGDGVYACPHPAGVAHESVVQRFPSSQLAGAPPAHVPPLQKSPVVQTLP